MIIERLRDSFVKAENAAFINGDGKKRPKGILSGDHDIVNSGEVGDVVTRCSPITYRRLSIIPSLKFS